MNWTQSAVKDFESSCPRRWYDEWMDGNKPKPSPDMVKGQFFETLCLGSGAHNQSITTLPLIRGDKKSADHLRIEKQAERFKDLFNKNSPDWIGFEITQKQLHIDTGDKSGTIDFMAEPLSIWDLKLTKDLDGYWSESPDFTQQIYYKHLYKEKFGIDVASNLIIFEYSPKMRVKWIEVVISEESTIGVLNRVSASDETLQEYLSLDEFPRVPSIAQCLKCPLLCEKRNRINVIYERRIV